MILYVVGRDQVVRFGIGEDHPEAHQHAGGKSRKRHSGPEKVNDDPRHHHCHDGQRPQNIEPQECQLVYANIQKHPICRGGDQHVGACADQAKYTFERKVVRGILPAKQYDQNIDQTYKYQLEKSFVRITAVGISLRQRALPHEQVNHLYAAVHKVHTKQHQIDGDRNDRAVSALVRDRSSRIFHRLTESAEHAIRHHKHSEYHEQNRSRIDLYAQVKHILEEIHKDNV